MHIERLEKIEKDLEKRYEDATPEHKRKIVQALDELRKTKQEFEKIRSKLND